MLKEFYIEETAGQDYAVINSKILLTRLYD